MKKYNGYALGTDRDSTPDPSNGDFVSKRYKSAWAEATTGEREGIIDQIIARKKAIVQETQSQDAATALEEKKARGRAAVAKHRKKKKEAKLASSAIAASAPFAKATTVEPSPAEKM